LTVASVPRTVNNKITILRANLYWKNSLTYLCSSAHLLSFPISSRNAAAAHTARVMIPMVGKPKIMIIPMKISKDRIWFRQSTFQANTVPIRIARNMQAASALVTAR